MNILNILKDKPKGTKLYSPICGEFIFKETSISIIVINGINNRILRVFEDGKYSADGECLLFPSNEMRDWNKFAWKKGDVLKCSLTSSYCIFEKFINDEYTQFIGRYVSPEFNEKDFRELGTNDWISDVDDNIKISFIHNIENHYGGKLNLETLKIEKKEHEFKPFDRILGRDRDDENWRADIFRSLDTDSDYPYKCMYSYYVMCIPYEGNEHLLNTTDNPTE